MGIDNLLSFPLRSVYNSIYTKLFTTSTPTWFLIIANFIVSFIISSIEHGLGNYFESILRFIYVNRRLIFQQGECDLIRSRNIPVSHGFVRIKEDEVTAIINAFLSFQGMGALRIDLPNREGLRLYEYLRIVEITLNYNRGFRLWATWDNSNLDFIKEFQNSQNYLTRTLPKTEKRVFICDKNYFDKTVCTSSEWQDFENMHNENGVALYLLTTQCLNILINRDIPLLRSYEFGIIVRRNRPEYVFGIASRDVNNQQVQSFYLNIGVEAENYYNAIDAIVNHIISCDKGCRKIVERKI